MANNTSLDHCSRCGHPANIQQLAAWPHICSRCQRRCELTASEQVQKEKHQRIVNEVARTRLVADAIVGPGQYDAATVFRNMNQLIADLAPNHGDGE